MSNGRVDFCERPEFGLADIQTFVVYDLVCCLFLFLGSSDFSLLLGHQVSTPSKNQNYNGLL